MREMRREPEVPEARVPVVECLDGPARITLKELAPIHSVKNSILQCACSTSQKKCRFGEKCSYAHRQVDEQPSKKFKKNGGKSAVFFFLKNTRQLGCVCQDMEPAEVFIDFAEEVEHTEANPMCSIH